MILRPHSSLERWVCKSEKSEFSNISSPNYPKRLLEDLYLTYLLIIIGSCRGSLLPCDIFYFWNLPSLAYLSFAGVYQIAPKSGEWQNEKDYNGRTISINDKCVLVFVISVLYFCYFHTWGDFVDLLQIIACSHVKYRHGYTCGLYPCHTVLKYS